MKLRGLVLAGGRSRRFGRDKALARVDGRTMLERAVALLQELELEPVVIANAFRNYGFLPCPVVNDVIPEKGPVGGLYTACCLYDDDAFLAIPCDMPWLSVQLLQRLINEWNVPDTTAVFSDGNRLQPFPGIYPRTLRSDLLRTIQRRRLSIREFLEAFDRPGACPADGWKRPGGLRRVPRNTAVREFQNVNEPGALLKV